jgi:hypothetical protein
MAAARPDIKMTDDEMEATSMSEVHARRVECITARCD